MMKPKILSSRVETISRNDGKPTCANCLYCKLVPGTLSLKCSMAMWTYEGSGEERRITVLPRELTRRLDHRSFFDQARRCDQFSSMEEEA